MTTLTQSGAPACSCGTMEYRLRCMPPFPYRPEPAGDRVRLEALCEAAGLRCVVTCANPVDIRIHDGEEDFIAALPGRRIYCFAARLLPDDPHERAFFILHRMAFGALEWACREIVFAHHREVGVINSRLFRGRHAQQPSLVA